MKTYSSESVKHLVSSYYTAGKKGTIHGPRGQIKGQQQNSAMIWTLKVRKLGRMCTEIREKGP